MAKNLNLEIIAKEIMSNDCYKLTLFNKELSTDRPGQFVNIKIDGTFLRRPISIFNYDNDKHELTIIFKVVGEGTKLLSKYAVGDVIDTLTNLGNGFIYEENDMPRKKALLVGGGIGIYPLYALAKKMNASGYEITTVLGYRSKKEVQLVEEFNECSNVIVCTDDGSYGEKGNVIDVINLNNIEFDMYFSCGPEGMLRALWNYSKQGLLSFERRMGCGFGACMGCSCKLITGGYKRICVEGPVMNAKEVDLNDVQ